MHKQKVLRKNARLVINKSLASRCFQKNVVKKLVIKIRHTETGIISL